MSLVRRPETAAVACAIALGLAGAACMAVAQNEAGAEPPAATQEEATLQDSDARERLLEVARQVMVDAGNCILITLDAEGAPQARAMDPFPPEQDLTVWMATRAGTRKLQQLRADARATLTYLDREGGGYVTLIGTAEIFESTDEKARYWKPAWSDFYDDENRGDDYVLIRFQVRHAEIVSQKYAVAADPKAWKPAILTFR